MATIVLSAVGALVGGPIGAAVGAAIGQQVDNVIFAPGRRQGPRLGDLTLQTSSYGAPIPKLFGTVRVAGTVIWATDLKETRTTQSNGKGRGSTDLYSYSASFAVALSGRRILDIRRIWADGKLLRGAAGDFKSETGFRYHDGSEDQPLDPLIAASEGIGATPAYRGLAYAVFEDMQLATFGNRIPSLSFEVIADSGGAMAGSVVAILSGAVTSDGGPALGGMAAAGDSVRGVAEVIARATPFAVAGNMIRFGDGPLRSIADEDLGATIDRPEPRHAVDRIAATAIPDLVTIVYHDSGRDYLVGSQRARRDSAARREIRLEFPATLEAAAAKSIADVRLARLWAERTRATVKLPWRALIVGPGDRIAVPGLNGIWRVTRTALQGMAVKLELVLCAAAPSQPVAADAGRNRAQTDLPHGPTTLQVIDLPQIADAPETSPTIVVAANGASGGWRRAALSTSIDGGATYAAAGATALPATIGRTMTIMGAGSTALIDGINSVDVELVHAGLALADADTAALLAGANAAMIGSELLQYGRAEPLGGGRWRLSELWRGRRGTEWAAVAHPANSAFVLIDARMFASLPVAASVAGVRVSASGVGDAVPAVALAPSEIGAATRPLAPVDVRAVSGAGNAVTISWTRRSRQGWQWSDLIDAPVAEDSERYRVTKRATGRPDLVEDVAVPSWIYSASERSADLAAGATSATIEIAQVGTLGVSKGATIMISTS